MDWCGQFWQVRAVMDAFVWSGQRLDGQRCEWQSRLGMLRIGLVSPGVAVEVRFGRACRSQGVFGHGSLGMLRKCLFSQRLAWLRLASKGSHGFAGQGCAWRVYAGNGTFWQSRSCKLGHVTHWQGRDRVFLPVQAEPKEVQNDDKRETARNKR